jgi:hydrogenase maturation factor HypF (carbamoyltransferase family)
MTPALPINHVPLIKPKGALKPCRWCAGEYAEIVDLRGSDPEFHAGRVLCESCGRQIAWASARVCRRAERLVAA